MAAGIDDKIKALEEKLKQAKAQKAKIEARKKAIEAKVQRSRTHAVKSWLAQWCLR